MDIVIDFETLDTAHTTKVVSVAAVAFDVNTDLRDCVAENKVISYECKFVLSGQDNRTFSPETLKWWSEQSDEAKAKAFGPGGRVSLWDGTNGLINFIKRYRPFNVWACGPEFDMKILESLCDELGIELPVKFWQYRDVRTLEMAVFRRNTRKPRGRHYLGGTAHDALDDCIMEGVVVQQALQLLGEKL